MPLDALDNPVVLPLLGLLIEHPAHAYALAQRLAERYPHLDIRRSSVRTLVRSVAAAGLISPQRPRSEGRRPPHVAYALTEAGYSYVRARVTADIVAARAGSKRFVLALSYIGVLPRAAAADVLRRRLAVLLPELQSISKPPPLPEFQMLEVAYWHAIVRAEIAWVEKLQKRLVTDAIRWPRHRDAPRRSTR